jgi:hypothetical protein
MPPGPVVDMNRTFAHAKMERNVRWRKGYSAAGRMVWA